MATRLKDTDVVIIGLGAAGGVAALPLAQAGLEVVGLEAGSWLTKHDFAPDELRNNVRDWPHGGPEGEQRSADASRQRQSRRRLRPRLHPMMNAVGGTTLHYLGAELAAQPVGLQGRQRDHSAATARRESPRAQRSRTGRSATTTWSRITTRWNTRSASRARRATSREDRSAREHFRSAAARASIPCRRCAAPSSPRRWRRPRRALGWHPFTGAGRDQLATLSEPRGLHVPRFLQPGRVSRRREERPRS